MQRFEWQHQLGSTGVVLQDHSFLQPDYALAHSQSLRDGHEVGLGSDEQLGAFQHYDFPGRFKQDPQGKAFARYRLDALRQQVSCAEGHSNAPPLQLGLRWSLRGQGGADDLACTGKLSASAMSVSSRAGVGGEGGQRGNALPQ